MEHIEARRVRIHRRDAVRVVAGRVRMWVQLQPRTEMIFELLGRVFRKREFQFVSRRFRGVLASEGRGLMPRPRSFQNRQRGRRIFPQ